MTKRVVPAGLTLNALLAQVAEMASELHAFNLLWTSQHA